MRNGVRYEGKDGSGNRLKRVERQPVWKKVELYLLIIGAILIVNLFFLLKLQSQIRNMNKEMNEILATLAVSRQEENSQKGELVAKQEEVENPQYNAAPGESLTKDTSQPEEVDYVALCGLEEVDKPVNRNPSQVLARLEELAQDHEGIAEIYDNHSSYPAEMLKALANNPEMADFVSHFLTVDAKASGEGLTKTEKEQEYPLFLQWDPRWGYAEYGDGSNIGLSGCGPTCLSMMLYYLLEDESLTPDAIADYSMENGYYMSGSGTAWRLLEDMADIHGLYVSQPNASDRRLRQELDRGHIIICSMKPGDFTAGGHFIVIYGYDEEGYLVNDPNCVARSHRKWTFDEIGKQIKHTWSYSTEPTQDYKIPAAVMYPENTEEPLVSPTPEAGQDLGNTDNVADNPVPEAGQNSENTDNTVDNPALEAGQVSGNTDGAMDNPAPEAGQDPGNTDGAMDNPAPEAGQDPGNTDGVMDNPAPEAGQDPGNTDGTVDNQDPGAASGVVG